MASRLRAAAAVLLAWLVAAPAGATHTPYPGTARYSVPVDRLDAALDCHGGKDELDGSGELQPVLLVHGFAITREDTFEWNYWSQLPTEGFEVCWLALPKSSVGDLQVVAEYVARAIEFMRAETGEKVDILTHSTGGLDTRWAIRYFPSGPKVADYIALVPPNHGTSVADDASSHGWCPPACWQLRTDSRYVAVLNEEDETPGRINYTTIYTENDELIQPVGTQALDGAENILLQDVCPGRVADHGSILRDGLAYLLVEDALRTKGPADPERLPDDACTVTVMPGSSSPPATFPDYSEGRLMDHEPPLRRYAR